jgi:hypothetical protein
LPEVEKVRNFYTRLAIEDQFLYREHSGGHEVDHDENGIDFLVDAL